MVAMKIIRLKIEKLNLGGQGIGYFNGKVCFVDFVIPGEMINAEIIIEKSDYNVARCVEILEPSPARIEPLCPIYKICGGCQFQHIDYETQVQIKKDVLIDTLRHIGKTEICSTKVNFGEPWYYRNRAQLPVQNKDGLKIGYFKKGTHEVVDHNVCYINQKEINNTLTILRERIKDSNIEIYDEASQKGNLRHIVIKRGVRTKQIFVIFVARKDALSKNFYEKLMEEIPEIAGIGLNINKEKTNRILGNKNILLAGSGVYEEIVNNKKFQIGPTSFFQINIPVFEKIIEKIKEEIQGSIVVELYAGVGVIGICIAQQCNNLVVIEENAGSVREGVNNARLNNIENIEFVQGRVEKKLNIVEKCDTLIMDPPRKGVGEDIIKNITKMGIRKIIYLSCNPATLARDASLLIKNGYHIKDVDLFDMFPQTYHIESLMVFEK